MFALFPLPLDGTREDGGVSGWQAASAYEELCITNHYNMLWRGWEVKGIYVVLMFHTPEGAISTYFLIADQLRSMAASE